MHRKHASELALTVRSNPGVLERPSSRRAVKLGDEGVGGKVARPVTYVSCLLELMTTEF